MIFSFKSKQQPAAPSDVEIMMQAMGDGARAASAQLALASTEQKNQALQEAAKDLRTSMHEVLHANAEDMREAKANNVAGSYLDRLMLNEQRLEAIAKGLEAVAALPDPVGRVMAAWQREDGLRFERVAVPIGVIGIIFESRPNVTADAGALCLKSGNVAILRTGSDSLRSALAIHASLQRGLENAGLPAAAIQLVPTKDRAAVGAMLRGLSGAIDVIVPRGGKSLVARVQDEARVPVFAHLEGICHVYVHAKANLEQAKAIVLNAKMRRTSVCGAAETLLLDEALPIEATRSLVELLLDSGCAVRGDTFVCSLDRRATPASEQDWATEYGDAIISAARVTGVAGAAEHIARYGSHHTDAIITEDVAAAQEFFRRVDSAIVLHNASTQFADGGEFGFGAEIGIATGRLHARGPVGLEQLTTFKTHVYGHGHIRP